MGKEVGGEAINSEVVDGLSKSRGLVKGRSRQRKRKKEKLNSL